VNKKKLIQHLKNWLTRKGFVVYKIVESYGDKLCPKCQDLLYCRSCAKEVPTTTGGDFGSYKPADLAVLRTPEGGGGYWIEVALVKNRTERGMVFHPKNVSKQRIDSLEKEDGTVAICFIQDRKPEKPVAVVVGTYLVRWSEVRDRETITREEIRQLAVMTPKDSDEIVPVKVEKKPDAVREYLDAG